MSTVQESSPRKQRVTIYIVCGVVILALIAVVLILYRSNGSQRGAEAKADELIAAVEAAGGQTPSKEQIVGVLGNDGGAICADPGDALIKAGIHGVLVNGAGGPGTRPVIGDNEVMRGVLLVVQVYCPEQLPDFVALIDDLKLDDVAEG